MRRRYTYDPYYRRSSGADFLTGMFVGSALHGSRDVYKRQALQETAMS